MNAIKKWFLPVGSLLFSMAASYTVAVGMQMKIEHGPTPMGFMLVFWGVIFGIVFGMISLIALFATIDDIVKK